MSRAQSLRLASILLAALLTSACATKAGLRAAPLTDGALRVYRADLQDTVEAVRASMTSREFEVNTPQEVAPGTWMMVGEKAASAFSWGELVRAVVQPDPGGGTALRIVTRRLATGNVTARGDWSGPIFDDVAKILVAKPAAARP